MICTFFGHRDVVENIQPILRSVLKDLIEQNGVTIFYVGNQGKYDFLVRETLKELKIQYPFISYSVVLAYMPCEKDFCACDDNIETIYPEELAGTHPKYAIAKRNSWMIDKSDFVVTYVSHISGGAAQFKSLAQRKNKKIIDIAEFI